MTVTDFWKAARAFRSAPDAAAKHTARVVLLNIALYGAAPVAIRAEDILRSEGLSIIRRDTVLPAAVI